jgi:hypothetical protein
VPLLLLLLALPLILVALMPLILWQRYRAGSARRLAKAWIATLNLVALVVSVLFFAIGAALTEVWIPTTLSAAAIGVVAGTVVGFLGLLMTRWEAGPRALHYTPNRYLVLGVTLIVSARILYGFWRGLQSVGATADGSFIALFGVPQSVGAGGVVLGYYLAYAVGLRWRIRQWQHRPLRVMQDGLRP